MNLYLLADYRKAETESLPAPSIEEVQEKLKLIGKVEALCHGLMPPDKASEHLVRRHINYYKRMVRADTATHEWRFLTEDQWNDTIREILFAL